jgi:hypothetical protein
VRESTFGQDQTALPPNHPGAASVEVVQKARYLRTRHIDLAKGRFQRKEATLQALSLLDEKCQLTAHGQEVHAYLERVDKLVEALVKKLRKTEQISTRGRRYELKSGAFYRILEQDVDAILQSVSGTYGLKYKIRPIATKPPSFILPDGQVWVLSRQVDVLIPENDDYSDPLVIMEIKEFWGAKQGGSKMSDMVYEAQLLGMELQTLRQKGIKIRFYLVLNGREQWGYRKGDLRKLMDIAALGYLDGIFTPRDFPALERQLLRDLEGLALTRPKQR